ncbi:TVP38/TMEM64 family protein [Reinekea marina]|uniref:TVP38/TMEM64 family membrane protein n=1 Tax=Reinekea marina TaxID=1310421 RepID=A0ABV7WTM2_9GAMM|nr:TVP38/TMEM64 family protein [Reinekea marina]MDN3647369.1 TVP38/TMEM64 family protein [Reinekea marina]
MKKIIILTAALLVIGSYFYFDLGQWLTLEQLKSQQAALEGYRANNPILVALIYMLTYIVIAALSLPGSAIMTLSGGAIFGLTLGTGLALVSATIGATFAFLIARFLLKDWVQTKFGDRIGAINQGINKDGAFYLFSLRLVPVFPFFVINVVMGITTLKVWTFFWVSLIGMLAGAAVYANAGTQLAKIDSLGDIASPAILLSFVLLGIFPILAKKIIEFIRQRMVVNTNSEQQS